MADEVVIHIEGMGCGLCVLTVTEALSAVTGVSVVQISPMTGRTVVTGHDLNAAAVRSAVARAGCTTHGLTGT